MNETDRLINDALANGGRVVYSQDRVQVTPRPKPHHDCVKDPGAVEQCSTAIYDAYGGPPAPCAYPAEHEGECQP